MPKGHYERTPRLHTQAEVSAVRLLEAHGFVNEYEAVYFKPAGSLITNAVEIAMLRARGAPLEDI